jgi:hypothetical protein
MFDGTDLSLAYGSIYEAPAPPAPIVQSAKPQPPPIQQMPSQQPMDSRAQAPDVTYDPPVAMYTQQTATPSPSLLKSEDVSFWDRLAKKRADVLKLFMFAMVILLALSMDHMASHYLTNYISKTILTDTQELFVRLSYPIFILLLIWIIKASA